MSINVEKDSIFVIIEGQDLKKQWRMFDDSVGCLLSDEMAEQKCYQKTKKLMNYKICIKN